MNNYPEYTGENVKFLYDRDFSSLPAYNYSDISIPAPDYGSRVVFSTKTTTTVGRDNYETILPMGINNVMAEFNLNFSNIWNSEANYILHKLNQAINGTTQVDETLAIYNSGIAGNEISFEGYYGTGSSIYKDVLSGCFVKDYSLNTKENFLCDLSVVLATDTYSSFMNYKGAFPNEAHIQAWNTGQSYEKFDVVYYPIFLDKRNNFFYCLQNHTSSTGILPQPESEYWTQSFFFEPDFAIPTNVDYSSSINNDGDFLERIKMNKNSNRLDMNLKFENRSNKETRAMMHFLENKMGYRSFKMALSGVYRSQKTFYVPSWSHTYTFYDTNSIEVEIKESIRNMAKRELNTTNFWNVL